MRKAHISDARSLNHLIVSLENYYNNEGISPFFAKKITVEAFEGYLMDEKSYEHYVCEEEGKIIGYFSLLNAIHFLYLFVDEKYHKQGVAKALVAYALKDKEHTHYSVNSSLYAVPFYEKLGFESVALVQKQHGMSSQYMVWSRV